MAEIRLPPPGRSLTNVIVGRFQPFTLGHLKMAERMQQENSLPTAIVVVKPSESSRFPFGERLTLQLLNEVSHSNSSLHEIVWASTAYIPEIIKALRRKGLEPNLLAHGSDRGPDYRKQMDYVSNKMYPPLTSLNLYEVDREDGISATKVREALKNGDRETFEKLTPEELNPLYEKLKEALDSGLNTNERKRKAMADKEKFVPETIEEYKEGNYQNPGRQGDTKFVPETTHDYTNKNYSNSLHVGSPSLDGYRKVKRKYGENPELRVSTYAPLRNKVLSFIGDREITRQEFKEYLDKLAGEHGHVRGVTVPMFVSKNKAFVKRVKRHNEEEKYRLTTYGKRVKDILDRDLMYSDMRESSSDKVFSSVEEVETSIKKSLDVDENDERAVVEIATAEDILTTLKEAGWSEGDVYEAVNLIASKDEPERIWSFSVAEKIVEVVDESGTDRPKVRDTLKKEMKDKGLSPESEKVESLVRMFKGKRSEGIEHDKEEIKEEIVEVLVDEFGASSGDAKEIADRVIQVGIEEGSA